uniref:Uncharacterized protein n=1 Tax=Anguilla anguilla TaxID=7936 RepID=A0A0E9QIB5_ANGAN
MFEQIKSLVQPFSELPVRSELEVNIHHRMSTP